MRIISGIYKNHKLESPFSKETHPMGDREKIALFNMLESGFGSLEGTEVLDAYAGTGALGLEAISRGAKSVIFVEKSKKTAKILENNLKSLQNRQNSAKFSLKNSVFPPKNAQNHAQAPDSAQAPKSARTPNFSAKILQKSVESASFPENSFDIIFADPPYDNFDFAPVFLLASYLKPSGFFVISSPKPLKIPDFPGLSLVKSRNYANATISLFQKS
ncbi:RsmD family RNA methyltransferase [Candidatus Saccharibacteria bacterium]|nr:RsmD family RNA methyltransferase [Candidatus Saccharibacteria bacterium]